MSQSENLIHHDIVFSTLQYPQNRTQDKLRFITLIVKNK